MDDKRLAELGFDVERQKTAKKYSQEKLLVSVIESVFVIGILLLFAFSNFSSGLASWALGLANNSWFVVGLYMLPVMVFFSAFSLPFDYLRGYHLEHKYDLSNQNIGSWMMDQMKGFAISLIFGLVVVELIYFFLRTFPDYWWVFGWGFMTAFILFSAFIAPVLLLPLFFKSEELEDEELSAEIRELMQEAGVGISGIYKLMASEKTKKANAALAGLGSTRRVYLFDTLTENYGQDQILSIVGHEVGHHKYHHIPKLIFMNSGLYLASFFLADLVLGGLASSLGYSGISDIAFFPFFVLFIGLFSALVQPASNAISRVMENNADEYALDRVGKGESYARAFAKMTHQNLSVASPNPLVEFLLYSHPSPAKRVEKAHLWSSQPD